MKVLYLTVGLPHYFNLVLSRINSEQGIELVVVAPKGSSGHVGAGVYQTLEGVNFRVIFLEEYAARPFFLGFRGLAHLLLKERPDVVMMPDHILRGFQFHPGLVLLRRALRFGLVLKSIPFRIPDYRRSIEDIEAARRALTGGVRRKVSGLLSLTYRYAALLVRKRRFQAADAHAVYVDEGRELYASYGVPPEKIFVTRNSPDTDALKTAELAILQQQPSSLRCPRRIIFVGRLVPEKRADLLIRAFRTAHERFPDAELAVIGSGPEQASLQDLVHRSGLDQSVRFCGGIYDPVALGTEFMKSSLFVLPGLGGLSINEAMFYRLPIICAQGDGTERHLVREEINGAFFEDGNEQDLARAIVDMLADVDRLKSMGERSREIIEREVNIQSIVAEYLRVFRFAASEKSASVG